MLHLPDDLVARVATRTASESDERTAAAHLPGCVDCREKISTLALAPTRRSPNRPEREEAPATDELMSRRGRYLLLKRLGSGGMGVVYAAYDPDLDRKVALKLIAPQVRAGRTVSEGRALLLAEAKAMAKLSHPNVVAVYDVGIVDNDVFIAMELVDGGTLADWLKQKPPAKEILDVLRRAGRGLEAAHLAGLVHRDFKPHNVLLRRDRTPLVSDFGIAFMEDEAGATFIAGTPGYMPPEQMKGGKVDARADQFAFCVTTYEALTGAPPFPTKVLDDLAGRPSPAPPSGLPAAVKLPSGVGKAIAKGLNLDPAHRWPGMEELLEELAKDPSAQRRRALGAAVLGLSVLGSFALAYQLSDRSAQLCTGAERKLDGIWDAARRAELEAAFLNASPDQGKFAFAAVSRVFDQYARDFVAGHTDACRATRVRGEQPEAVMAQRMRCLERRLYGFEATVALFSHADAALVRAARTAATNLDRVQDCGNAEVLRSNTPAPKPEEAAVVQAIDRQLEAVHALQSAGRWKAAEPTLQAAAAAASTLSYSYVKAKVSCLQAHADVLGRGKVDDPATELKTRDCLSHMLALGEDRVAIGALRLLISSAGVNPKRRAEVQTWVSLAEALISRDGMDEFTHGRVLEDWARTKYFAFDPAKGIEVLENARAIYLRLEGQGPHSIQVGSDLADYFAAEGQYEKALPLLDQAIVFYEKTEGPDSPLLLAPLEAKGRLLVDLGKAADALPFLERARDLAERYFSSNHANTAQVLVVLARAERGTHRYAEALEHARAAEELFATATGSTSMYSLAARCDRVAVLTDLERYDDAIGLAVEAIKRLEAADGPDTPLLVDLLHALSTTELRAGNPPDAAKHLERALRIVAGYPDDLNPETRAQMKFELAQALEQTAGGSKQRSRQLAEEARAIYEKFPHTTGELAEVDQWLQAHGAGAPAAARKP